MIESKELFSNVEFLNYSRLTVEIDDDYPGGLFFIVEIGDFKGRACIEIYTLEHAQAYLNQLNIMNQSLTGKCSFVDEEAGYSKIDFEFKGTDIIVSGCLADISDTYKLIFDEFKVDQTILNGLISVMKKIIRVRQCS